MKHNISVIISIFNVEQYVSHCINSVLGQSYMPYEIILVNDGSTDKSIEICNTYQQKYPELIKVINKSNGGLSSARNAGIHESGGGIAISLMVMTTLCLIHFGALLSY